MSEPITKERLSRLHVLRREVTRTKRRLADLKALCEGEACDKKSALAYARVKAALERYLGEMLAEQAELLGYIQAIEDASVRELFMLRYYDGIRPWQKVAFLAGEHDESYVRRKHDTYLRKMLRANRKSASATQNA